MRHTKILATLGPSSETAEQIESFIASGVDAVRLNFSHGTSQWHETAYQRVRNAAKQAGRAIAVVQDLQGPKIRLGEIEGNGIEVLTGASLVITTHPIRGSLERIPTTYSDLPSEVSNGNRILIDDGRIQLVVEKVEGTEIHCRVLVGGVLSSRKGIHVPGATSNTPTLSEKDKADAHIGLSLGVDFMALSFVRGVKDVENLREWMKQKGKTIPIISKIETSQAIEHLDEIVAASDGVMVARGDLGVEVSLEMIPFYQKKIIQRANSAGKIVITATQMLESMMTNPSPTRAEVTDIANSILDGTDAIMLSGETAIGRFPVETVKQMASIAETTEMTLYPFDRTNHYSSTNEAPDFAAAAARLIGQASRELRPEAIVVFTRTSHTANLISAERPRTPILAFTPEASTYRRMSLLWGVVPREIREVHSPQRMVAEVTRHLLNDDLVKKEDTILYLLGSNTSPGGTNMIRIARAGDVAEELEQCET